MKKLIAAVTAAAMLTMCASAAGAGLGAGAKSVILMDRHTGAVLYEEDSDRRLPIASVTKVMTLLLVCEALEEGNISLEDQVTASADAAGMGGSQIYLKEGESMPLEDMLKSVIIASANDAAVALGEYIAGSQAAFVQRMNNKAESLGLENTAFMNCTGLPAEGHYSSAGDVAVMSRELLKYDIIKKYTTVWMDSVRSGEFVLTNTNKMIRSYKGLTGLKTGFTDEAGFCVSATAEKNGMELIAVVLGSATGKERFESAAALLDHGFSNWEVKDITEGLTLPEIKVELGREDTVPAVLDAEPYVLLERTASSDLTVEVDLPERVNAPVARGDILGTVRALSGGEVIYEAALRAANSIERLKWHEIYLLCLKHLLCSA